MKPARPGPIIDTGGDEARLTQWGITGMPTLEDITNDGGDGKGTLTTTSLMLQKTEENVCAPPPASRSRKRKGSRVGPAPLSPSNNPPASSQGSNALTMQPTELNIPAPTQTRTRPRAQASTNPCDRVAPLDSPRMRGWANRPPYNQRLMVALPELAAQTPVPFKPTRSPLGIHPSITSADLVEGEEREQEDEMKMTVDSEAVVDSTATSSNSAGGAFTPTSPLATPISMDYTNPSLLAGFPVSNSFGLTLPEPKPVNEQDSEDVNMDWEPGSTTTTAIPFSSNSIHPPVEHQAHLDAQPKASPSSTPSSSLTVKGKGKVTATLKSVRQPRRRAAPPPPSNRVLRSGAKRKLSELDEVDQGQSNNASTSTAPQQQSQAQGQPELERKSKKAKIS